MLRSPAIAFLCALAALLTPASALAKPGHAPCRPGDPSSPTCLAWKAKAVFVADGDTIDARIPGIGVRRIRLTGFNATELRVYSRRASRRRGECRGVEAANTLEHLIRESHWRVRLVAERASSHSGRRLRRSVQVHIGGRWKDVGPTLLAKGLAIWMPNDVESAWTGEYSRIAQRAAANHVGLFDAHGCGPEPDPGARLAVRVNWDADGNDFDNVNGEWIEVRNLDPDHAVSLGHWLVRDSIHRYKLPAWASVPAGGRLRVHTGHGHAAGDDFYFGFARPTFDQKGAGYLFDSKGNARAWMIYPCRFDCADPLANEVRLDANPYGKDEYVDIRNVSGSRVDLSGYVLALPWENRELDAGAYLNPGEVMRFDMQGDPSQSTRLRRYFGYPQYRLADRGQRVRLMSYHDIQVACTAWGDDRC
jgi:endonuclease YncB( thermonuclease family)